MRCLTLTQPYATLIAIGAKKIETRSWSTSYRGPLAIHAALTFPTWARRLCAQEPFSFALQLAGFQHPDALPCGVILAICQLVAVSPIDTQLLPAEPERSFGNYTSGRYAWRLEQVRALPEPVPARGALGLWQFKGEL